MKFYKLLNLVLENPDICRGQIWKEASRVFIMFPNECILWTVQPITHFQLFRKFQENYNKRTAIRKKFQKNFKNYPLQTEDGITIYINGRVTPEMETYQWHVRSPAIFAGCLIGRSWDIDKWVSFWNPLWFFFSKPSLQNNFKKLMKEMNYQSFDLEFGDCKTYGERDQLPISLYNDETMKNQTFKTTYYELVEFFKIPQKDAFPELSRRINDIHTLSPETKGKVMKDRGIQPKIPIPLAQRMRYQGGD